MYIYIYIHSYIATELQFLIPIFDIATPVLLAKLRLQEYKFLVKKRSKTKSN